MKEVEYVLVDVFSRKPFGGNPLAVFTDARGLSTRDMQLLAREMNLSETTFVLPPSRGSGADFRVRIFTPDAEIPYAGHPTLGTFFVLADTGRIPLGTGVTTATMECGAGVLPVEIHSSRGGKVGKVVSVQSEPRFMDTFDDIELVADALSLKRSDFDPRRMPVQLVSTGLPWLIAPVRTRRAVERALPDAGRFAEAVRRLPKGVVDIYVTCLDPVDAGSTTHSRGFCLVSGGTVEDPATGSASGCLGAYLVGKGLVEARKRTRILNEQGYEMGRPSRVEVEVRCDDRGSIESVRVGGSVVRLMEGRARF
jgi:trans-2,3-dihydro-3-hydroxyanthranilate isomerase